MDWNNFVNNLPYIISALGLLLWALSKVITAYAQKNPAIDKWDTRAEQLHMISDKYAQAIEWLVTSGFAKWSGAEKLAMLNSQMKSFEELWNKGSYVEAIAQLSGFYTSAKAKIEKVAAVTLPFAPRPSVVTNRVESGSSQAQGAIGPDDPATTNEA